MKYYIEVESESGCTLLSEDYINNSTKLIVKCICGKHFSPTFKSFKSMNVRQCKECSNKKLSKLFTKTHEEFINQVYNLVGCEYTVLTNYIKYHEYITIRHNKCNYEYDVTPANFISGYRCPKCAGNIKSNTEEFKEKIFKKYGNEFTVLGEYINSNTKIKVKHNICGEEYFITPNDFLSGNKCWNCSGLKTKNINIIKQDVYGLVGSEYSVDGQYKTNKTKLEFMHIICGNKFKMSSNNFLNGQRCPYCNYSKGEKVVSDWFSANNVEYKPQKTFDGLIGVNKGSLSYDFYLPQYNLLIEYQGEQHEQYIKGFHKSKKDFEIQQEHDRRKREYAKVNSIDLLEIWYYDFDNIEEILSDKIKNI